MDLFTTVEVCKLTELTPRSLQSMLEAGVVEPVVKGGKGRGQTRRFSDIQVCGIAYAAGLLRAGCDSHTWAYKAGAWVARQDPEHLAKEFRAGRTTLVLFPGGEGQLIELAIPLGASRKFRVLAAWLDLHKCIRAVLRRAKQLDDEFDEEAAERQPSPARGRQARTKNAATDGD